MFDIDIILLSLCNSIEIYEMNRKCIQSLIKSEEKFNFNIILIESNKNFYQEYEKYPFNNLNIIVPNEDFNYNRFLNIGLRKIDTEMVIIANNDLIFYPGWLSEIMKIKSKHPDIQSFCPIDPINEKEKFSNNNDDFILGYRLKKELVGWCIVFDKSILKKTGFFDERFSYYFQDNDYGNTLRRYNIRHARVLKSHVYHHESKTSKTISNYLYDSRGKGDEAIFLEKWGSYRKQHYRNKIHEILNSFGLNNFTKYLYLDIK